MKQKRNDMQQIIGNTLRWGVSLACVIAFIGGVIYLFNHGGELLPDYSTFAYDAEHPASYTTLEGVLQGVLTLNAGSIIQVGVIALILTPIMRVFLSLVEFLRERDWLYAIITSIVLAIIFSNSIGGLV